MVTRFWNVVLEVFTTARENIDSWTNQVGEIQSSVDYELIPENFVDFT